MQRLRTPLIRTAISAVLAIGLSSVIVPTAFADDSTPSIAVPDTTPTSLPKQEKLTFSKESPRIKRHIGLVIVDLSEQSAYVYAQNNPKSTLLAYLPVSTGLWDSTPTGKFSVWSKSARTFYTPNPGEKMDHMVRFTKGRNGGNIGFHSIPYTINRGKRKYIPTPVGVKPSSHGCIRLRVNDASWLYNNSNLGTTVVIVRR